RGLPLVLQHGRRGDGRQVGIEPLVLEQGTEPLAELGPLVHPLDQLGARGPLDEHVVGPVRERAGQTVVLEELPDVVPHVAAPHTGVDTGLPPRADVGDAKLVEDRKSTRLNSCHVKISYAVFCLKKKKSNSNANPPNTCPPTTTTTSQNTRTSYLRTLKSIATSIYPTNAPTSPIP